MAPGAPASASSPFLPAGILLDVLEVSLTAVNVLRPRRSPTGELVDFDLLYVNPAGQRMSGLPERPDGTLLTQFPHAAAAGIFAYYCRVYEAGATDAYEVNYQADGLDNYFRLAARRSDEWLVVSFTDTSDQDRSAVEAALRESQAAEQHARAEAECQRQRFHEVLMQLPAHVAVYQGPDHVYQFVNPPYQRQFPHRSFPGRRFRDAIPESNELGVGALFDQVYQTGEPVYLPELEGWFDFRGTGEPEQLFLNLSMHPLHNAQGCIDGVLDFSYDITEQVRARQQVEQLNEQLEARVHERTRQLAAAHAATERQRRQWYELFQQTPVGICIFDGPQWVYEFINPSYQALFPGRALLGKPLVEALPEVADQPLMAILHRVYDTGEPFEASEVLVPLARTADGPIEDIYFDLTYQARRNEAGQIDGFVTYALDVTAQVLARQQTEQAHQQVRHLNEELRISNEELYRSNRQLTRTNVDLDTFVYTASHDLKAPITNIEGILAALHDTLPPAVQQETVVAHLLGLLDNTVGRFITTIDQLTDLSRLQRAYDAPAERLALEPVVAGVLADLAPAIKAAAAQVQVAVPAELHVSVAPASLRSIVYNLLSNAVKYRDPTRPARIGLHATQQPEGVVLTVQDNGLGLTPSQQERLFGLFQRLHTHVEGTGVGLYMIKRLIENAGARITVTSTVGIGSTFTVTFPS